MFERLEAIAADPILGLMAQYRADSDPRKVDLGIGIYRDDQGNTPVLRAVREAETALVAAQTTKAYVGPTGNAGFNQQMERMVFGAQHAALSGGRVRSVQCPGGCGALRLGAELIRLAAAGGRGAREHAHLGQSRAAPVRERPQARAVPVLRPGNRRGAVRGHDGRARAAAAARRGAAARLLSQPHRRGPVAGAVARRCWRWSNAASCVPFIDMAYQGLGESLDADAFAIRLFCAELPEVLCAVSCSKNFGLYRDRVGALHVVNDTTKAADADAQPAGAPGARHVVDAAGSRRRHRARHPRRRAPARKLWAEELTEMRARIQDLRQAVVWQLREHCPQRDFGFIAAQRGMFSFFGISTAQVRALRERHHVYMTDDSRMNVAGLRRENLEYFARAVAQVLAG